MRLKTRVDNMQDDIQKAFDGVGNDMGKLLEMCQDLAEGREEDERVTNGVVEDLNRLEREVKNLSNALEGLRGYVEHEFRDLETNGVVTAIDKLNKEVFSDRVDNSGSALQRVLTKAVGGDPDGRATLRGKLDAVIQHLGLDISVKPLQVEEAKVVAKKVKTLKKGKK